MKTTFSLGITLALGLISASASADVIIPSGVMTSSPAGADFDYTITLSNDPTSQSAIGTFWFAWIPGQDYLPTAPLSLVTPDGWKVLVTHGSGNNGFGIQWVATSAAADVAPGASLDFGFRSSDSPATLAGDSPFFPGQPIGTSFVYPGAPFSDPGHSFLVRSVPEPSSLLLAACGGMATLGSSRLGRRLRGAFTRGRRPAGGTSGRVD